jgi:photosystem II stability/assembly factor-like uncharacterized protein
MMCADTNRHLFVPQKGETTMRYYALALVIVVFGYLATCTSRGDNSTATNSLREEEVTVLRPVPAILNEGTHPPVNATETQIKENAGVPFQFRRAQFINETHGWAMTLYSLYRTIDGGKTWERLPQEPSKDAHFIAFSFFNESQGWLVMVKADSTARYGVGHSSVIMNTDDGGRSWMAQEGFQDDVAIRDIQFLNQNEGLVVGYKGLDNRPDRCEVFVQETSNGGKDWSDISGAANAALRNQGGTANDRVNHVYWASSSVLILTEGGRVMSTTDRGKTWNTIVTLKDERPNGFISSTGFHKLVLDPQAKIRVVAGAAGDEGYWGDFVIPEQGRWTSYEINLTPIDDAVFLSDKEVIASGLNVRRTDEKSKLKDAGVILRSFDGGKSWQSIYRSKTFETFFFITRIKDNLFYAVSDTGTFLRFTLPQ